MQKAFGAHPGAFHRATGTPEGEKIPEKKVASAERSKSGHMRKMANLAEIGKRYGGGKRSAKRWLMIGHGSALVENSPEDKMADKRAGIKEGSPKDMKVDAELGKKLFAKRMAKRSEKR
jgi:hypothetical protein